MTIEKLKELPIKKILINEGTGNLDLKLLIFLEEEKIIYFNSLWFHSISEEDLLINPKIKFNVLKIKGSEGNSLFITNIYAIEGVASYILLSNSTIIYIHEEIVDLNQSINKTILEVVDNSNESYIELINDIKEDGEVVDIIDSIPSKW